MHRKTDLGMLLINNGADVNAKAKGSEGMAETPLHWAAKRGDLELARALRARGASNKVSSAARRRQRQRQEKRQRQRQSHSEEENESKTKRQRKRERMRGGGVGDLCMYVVCIDR